MKIFFTGVWMFLALTLATGLKAQGKIKFEILKDELIFTDASFKQCHASTLVEASNGDLITAWFGGSYEGADDVCIYASICRRGKWVPPFVVVRGQKSDGSPVPCWNPVLFSPDDSTIMLYYKQGLSPRQWQGMFIVSHDSGKTWSKPFPLDGYTGPVKNKPLITSEGTWLNPSSIETTDRWMVFIERSVNKGKTWDIIPLDTSNPAKVIQPCLFSGSNGRIHAFCRSNQNYIMSSWSDDDGKSWTPLRKTELPNPNAGIDAITLQSGIHLLVYNPEISGADWWKGRNRLSIAVSSDVISWEKILDLENVPKGEFSYPSVIQTKDGVVHITYTYNRVSIKHIALILK